MIWWNTSLLTVGYISSIVNLFSFDGTLIGSGKGAPATAVCHLQWNSNEQDLLWIGGYMGLALVRIAPVTGNTPSSLELTTLIHRIGHETAACGLFLDSNDIYSGDLSGNIFQWTLADAKPKRRFHIDDSVRCFLSPHLVGTLSGALYNLDTAEIIENYLTTIICSAWNRQQTVCLIGLGDGRLVDLQTKTLVGLHANNAEIWSVCWSPDEEFCATASEDQTTCVWKADGQQKLIATLRGHTTAVTAVQWKCQRIYTCADDRTIRVYNTASNDYPCLYVLQTPKSVFGWFTLTYLQVDEEQHLIICTTQNGYLLVWRENEDRPDNQPILCQKLHFGSVEGLAYDKHAHRVVTTSSDCSVTVLRLHLD